MEAKRGRKRRDKTPPERVRDHPELDPENPADNAFELVSVLSQDFFDVRWMTYFLSRAAVTSGRTSMHP